VRDFGTQLCVPTRAVRLGFRQDSRLFWIERNGRHRLSVALEHEKFGAVCMSTLAQSVRTTRGKLLAVRGEARTTQTAVA